MWSDVEWSEGRKWRKERRKLRKEGRRDQAQKQTKL